MELVQRCYPDHLDSPDDDALAAAYAWPGESRPTPGRSGPTWWPRSTRGSPSTGNRPVWAATADQRIFAILRDLADVLLVGAGTIRAEGYGGIRLDRRPSARRQRWGLGGRATGGGDHRAADSTVIWASSPTARRPPIVITTTAGAQRMSGYPATVIEAGSETVDLRRMVAALGRSGFPSGALRRRAWAARAADRGGTARRAVPDHRAADAWRRAGHVCWATFACRGPVAMEPADPALDGDQLFTRYRRARATDARQAAPAAPPMAALGQRRASGSAALLVGLHRRPVQPPGAGHFGPVRVRPRRRSRRSAPCRPARVDAGRTADPITWSDCPEEIPNVDPLTKRSFTLQCAEVEVPKAYDDTSVRNPVDLGGQGDHDGHRRRMRRRWWSTSAIRGRTAPIRWPPSPAACRRRSCAHYSVHRDGRPRHRRLCPDRLRQLPQLGRACCRWVPTRPHPRRRDQIAELARTLTFDCGDMVGPDLSDYSTVLAADDLDSIRSALGRQTDRHDRPGRRRHPGRRLRGPLSRPGRRGRARRPG